MNNYMFRLLTLLFGICYLMLTSCSTSRYLQEDELLFDEVEINMETDEGFFERRSLKNELKNAIEPPPTTEQLGFLRIKQWFYSLYSEDVPEKGFKHWVKYRLGEPPQLYKSDFLNTNVRNFQNLLFNNGYFLNQVESEELKEDKRVTLKFDVKTNEPFHIDTIVYPDTVESHMNKIIYNHIDKSVIEPGDQYNITALESETERVNSILKNNGYYYFNPNYLIFKIDTTIKNHQVDVFLEYTREMPERASRVWKIKNTYIHTAYDPENSGIGAKDTILFDDFHVIYGGKRYVEPEPLAQAVLLEPDDIYRGSDHESTLNKLMGLGLFRFVNVNFSPFNDSDSSFLNTNINLTRQVPRSIQAEVQAVTKSNDYTGPNINLSYRDQNLFNGAETFEVRANGGFETQLGNTAEGLNSYEIGLETELTFPRFIVPFFDANQWLAKRYIPKSSLNTDISLTQRINYFRMNSARLSWGYIWQETLDKKHSVYPINLNYINITERTNTFEELLADKPLLEQSFKEQFILSLMYNYQQRSDNQDVGGISSFLTLNTEIAGNALNLFNRVLHDQDPGDFFGTPYSQFVKALTDIRFYYKLRKSSLVNRWVLGMGYPYGNSRTLPYNRQFFIGGTSSIRAFNSRSIGPGTYNDTTGNIYSFEQSGDIKFEANLEYRFDIYNFLKGAIFYDIGNIWLIRGDEDKPGGKFQFDDFFSELAMGTGFGLRIDANFLVFRVDVGIPMQVPYNPIGKRWVLDDISFNDLVLNIAIGYPF